MATVPTVTAPTEAPLPQISPEIAGSGYGAVAGMANTLQQTAEYGTHVWGMIQRAQTHVALMKAENQIASDIENHAASFAMRTDYQAFEKDTGQIENDLKTKYKELYGKDPTVWAAVEPHLDHQINQFRKAVFAKGVKLLTDDGKYQLDVQEESMAKAWALAGSPQEKAAIENEFQLKTFDAAQNHIITQDEALKRTDRFMKKREEADVILKSRSSDPATVEQAIQALGEPNTYPHIDPKELATFQASAEKHLETLNKKIESTNEKQVVNLAADYLDRKWSVDGKTDFDAVHKQLDDPDFRKEHGLDVKATEQVRTFFDGRQAEQDKTQTKEQKKYANDMADAFAKGDLSKVHQMVLSAGDKLTAGEKRTWIEAIEHEKKEARTEARLERTEDRQRKQEKSDEIFGELVSKISVGEELSTTKDIYGRMKDGLKATQAHTLATMNKGDKDPNFKLGVDVINDAFNSGILDATARGKAIVDLNEAVKTGNLKGKDIIDKAKEISHPKVQSAIGKILDSVYSRFGKKAVSPLEGKPAGRYRVDGKEVNWDGSKVF